MSYAAMSAAAAEMLKQSPLYAHYAQVAPRPEDWPVLIGKTSELLKVDDDWRDEVAALEAQTMLSSPTPTRSARRTSSSSSACPAPRTTTCCSPRSSSPPSQGSLPR
jgi:hypothetical protein